MYEIKRSIRLLSLLLLPAFVITACNMKTDFKKLMEVNKKISTIPGVMSSTINLPNSYDTYNGKSSSGYVINARVADLPQGKLKDEKIVREIVNTVMHNEPKIDSFEYVKVVLSEQMNAVVVHTSKSISVSYSPVKWREILNAAVTDSAKI